MESYFCTERINLTNLNRILKAGKMDDETTKKLERLKNRVKKTGKHTIEFSPKNHLNRTRGIGRLYPKNGVQTLQDMPRNVRKALAYDQYSDLDIVNCHPVLLSQLFKKEGITCESLDDYIENREERIIETQLSRDDAKQLFITLMYNGRPRNDAPEFIKNFYRDFTTCSVNLINLPKYAPYKKVGELKKEQNPLGCALSFLAQDLERQCISIVINLLKEKGYECSTLIHDGCHIRNLDVPDEIVREAEQEVKHITGYDIKLTIKPMNDFSEDTLWDEEQPIDDEDVGDTTNARWFLTWMLEQGHHFVRCMKQPFWYNPDVGTWTSDLTDIRSYISQCPTLSKIYCESSTKKDHLLKEMVYPRDDMFLANATDTTYKKLAFQNGVWDFKMKQLVPFNHEYRFFFKSPIKLIEKHNDEVFQKLFVDVFGEEKATFMLQSISRAMSGEIYDKVFFNVIGEANSGKGTLTEMLMGAFGKFIGNINASVFSSHTTSGDQSKARSWLCFVKDCRIILSNEIAQNQMLETSIIKTLSSGGDPITARQNHQDEYTFKCQATCMLFVNDMPSIRGLDDATVNRLRYVSTEYSYLEGDDYERRKTNPEVRQADPTIKNVFIKDPEVIEAFAYLVCNAYEPFKPRAPESVLQESKQWTETDDINEKISSLFITTGNKADFISAKQLISLCGINNIDVSSTRLGRLMRKFGHPAVKKKIEGRTTAVYEGVKLDRAGDFSTP